MLATPAAANKKRYNENRGSIGAVPHSVRVVSCSPDRGTTHWLRALSHTDADQALTVPVWDRETYQMKQSSDTQRKLGQFLSLTLAMFSLVSKAGGAEQLATGGQEEPLRVSVEAAADHLGEWVTVCGTIAGVEHSENQSLVSALVTLEAGSEEDAGQGRASPKLALAVCRSSRDLSWPADPFRGGYLCATGLLTIFSDERLGISVGSRDRLRLVTAESPSYLSGVEPSRYRTVPPDYSEAARAAKIEGSLDIDIVVDTNGEVLVASIGVEALNCRTTLSPGVRGSDRNTSTCRGVALAALEAASRWKYSLPAGIATPILFRTRVGFDLVGGAEHEPTPQQHNELKETDAVRATVPCG